MSTTKITHLRDTLVAEVGYVVWLHMAPTIRGAMVDGGMTLGSVPQSGGLDEAVFEKLRANFRGELLRFLWHNAGARSMIYTMAGPGRWVRGLIRRRSK